MIIQVAHLNPVPGHIGYDKTLEWRGEGCSPRGLWGQRLLDRPTISMYCTPSSWRFGTFCLDCRGSTWFVSSVRLSGRTAWLRRSMWSNKSATASGGQRSTSLPPWSLPPVFLLKGHDPPLGWDAPGIAFPPFSLLPSVVHQVQTEEARLVLVAPHALSDPAPPVWGIFCPGGAGHCFIPFLGRCGWQPGPWEGEAIFSPFYLKWHLISIRYSPPACIFPHCRQVMLIQWSSLFLRAWKESNWTYF